MKKLVLFAGVSVLALGAVSCKKDYECACTYKEFHDDHYDDESKLYPLGKLKKDDADAECQLKAVALSADPDHSQINCEVKAK
jgi:hypothetical protein